MYISTLWNDEMHILGQIQQIIVLLLRHKMLQIRRGGGAFCKITLEMDAQTAEEFI